tara:strand:- start:2234 stop:2827 length:594 start_codon:yes stop_codon:yes gene_type:complete
MSCLKKSIKIFNNLNNINNNISNENLYIEEMKKHELFINNVYNLPNYLNIFFDIKKKTDMYNELINNIITVKLKIDSNCQIKSLIEEYLNYDNINTYENKKPSNEKVLDIFLRKCHYDNLLDYRNNKLLDIINHNKKINKLLNNDLFNKLITTTYIEFNERNIIFGNYELYIEYVLYWLDLHCYLSDHYYKLKHSLI